MVWIGIGHLVELIKVAMQLCSVAKSFVLVILSDYNGYKVLWSSTEYMPSIAIQFHYNPIPIGDRHISD